MWSQEIALSMPEWLPACWAGGKSSRPSSGLRKTKWEVFDPNRLPMVTAGDFGFGADQA